MSTTMRPSDYEEYLQARVRVLQAEQVYLARRRAAARQARGVGSARIGRPLRLILGPPAVALVLIAFVSSVVLATTVWDLTTASATATLPNGAIYEQGQPIPVSGTGVLDPFLRVGTNQAIEQGFSTNTNGQMDNSNGPWTHALNLASIPTILVGGVVYREFLLDINQVNSTPLLSLDEVKIFLASTPDLKNYNDTTEQFDGVSYPKAYDQGDNVIKLNYSLEAGSGKPDMTLLIPDSSFASVNSGANYCSFGQTGCNSWMGFYTKFGGYNNSVWGNNDGFEEWATIIRPVVNVSKTATPHLTRTFHWGIDKSVDQTTINIASGGTATFNYTVSVTHDAGTDSGASITGNIVITNPATLPDGTKTVDATVSTVTDAFHPTDNSGDTTGTVSCPGGLPQTLASGATLTCTYTMNLPAGKEGTNTATVTLSDTSVAPFTATAPVAFNSPTIIDGSVTVVDDKTNPGSPVTLGTVSYTDPSPKTFTYSLTQSGVAGTCTDYTNTATFTTNTTSTTGSDKQKVTVCVGSDLTVSKTANPAFGRKFTWGIDKSVDQTTINIASGGTATFNYTVSVTHDAGTNSGWTVSGNITVNNPNDWEAITATITDAVDNGGVCTVTNGVNQSIPASGSVTRAYSCTWALAPSSASGTNTATATWDKNAAHTPNGSATGTATFTFTNPTITDGSVTVVDDKTNPGSPVTLGTVSYTDPSPKTFTYSLTQSGVAGTCTDYTNTATFTTNTTSTTGSDKQKVTVCVGSDLTVSKTANPAFGRKFTWGIDKSVDQTTINIASGGTATFNYTVSVTHDAGTNSGWTVSGNITVNNPNDWEAITATITDAVDNGGVCTVTNGVNQSIPASGSVTRAYSCTWALAPSSASGTNTATATWDKNAAHTPNGSATGTATFTFTNPTITDGSVLVTDTNAVTIFNPLGILGVVSYTDTSPFTFTYSVTRTGVAGTCTNYNNTATFTTNTTQTSDSDSQTVTVCVGLNLTVDKTSSPTFTKTFHWDITKNVDQTSVTINNGGTATFNYTISVTHDGGISSGWQLTGNITVSNPNDWEAITATITDAVDNGGVCTVTNGTNVSIPASGSVTRAYSCSYANAPSPLSGTNTATATWDKTTFHTPNGSATGTAAADFSGAPTTIVDGSVIVSDTFAGTLGTVTYTDPSPKTFTYSRTITSADYTGCGTFTFPNTASFITNTSATTGSASQTVTVNVVGCGVFGKTLGFWHNKNGHAILSTDGINLITPVTIGSDGHTYTVTTLAQSDKILSNDDCTATSPIIFVCTGTNGLVSGLNPNTFEVLGAQTLALTYNIGNITGYSGNTISGLSCQSLLTTALTSAPLNLTATSSVGNVLTAANWLIGHSFKDSVGGFATQQQEGAMNALLGCLNRDS